MTNRCSLVIVTLMCLIWPLHAQQLQPIAVTQFDIKPLNCVTRYRGQECQLAIQLMWQTNRPADICFWQDTVKIRCWLQTQKVSVPMQVKLQQDSLFQLKTPNGNKPLVEQLVKINFTNQFRRSLRPKWSIF